MSATLSPPRSLSLLVVDDNVDGADTLALCLGGFGHTVSVAYDGDEAVERCLGGKFDALLCDIGLPGQSGYEVAFHARRLLGEGVLLIAVSAYTSDVVRESARRAGFDYYFAKPAEPDEIERVLEKHFSTET